MKKILIFCALLLFAISLWADFRWSMDCMVRDWFRDPIERCYVVMFNCVRFQFESGEDVEISATIGHIEEILEENGYRWNDIMLIIHNHFARPRFSPKDIKTYHEIKRRGFRGVYAICVTSTGMIYTMREVPRKEIEKNHVSNKQKI